MSEYYGVSTPSSDFLAHYGIKGMKWGVRKAIERGNQRALDRHFRKAAKKLEKLSKRADIEAQNQQVQKYNRIARRAGKIGSVGAGLAIAGTGTDHTLHYINSLHKKVVKNDLEKLSKKADDTLNEYQMEWKYYNKHDPKYLKDDAYREKIDKDLIRRHNEAQDSIIAERNKLSNDFNKTANTRKTAAEIGKYIGYAGAGIGALGLGTAIGSKIKAHAAKKRTTAEGHAKAVAERDAWKKEMQSAFKGTKYSNIPKINKKRRK